MKNKLKTIKEFAKDIHTTKSRKQQQNQQTGFSSERNYKLIKLTTSKKHLAENYTAMEIKTHQSSCSPHRWQVHSQVSKN